MAFVQRETNWGAHTGSAQSTEDKPKKQGTADRSNRLVPSDHLLVSQTAMDGGNGSSTHVDTSPTIEIIAAIAEACDVVVIAVTTDPDLRSALSQMLPSDGLVFADSPEQVLTRSVPSNCAVLIVEQSLSRPMFEQLKSYLKASAPATVNIMVGAHNDGRTLIGLLSTGCIDRFMVKPLRLGPARTALRSALEQHQSLRSRVKVDRMMKHEGSDMDLAPDAGCDTRSAAQAATRNSIQAQVKHSAKPSNASADEVVEERVDRFDDKQESKSSVVALPLKAVHPRPVSTAEPLNEAPKSVPEEPVAKIVTDAAVERPLIPPTGEAAKPRQLPTTSPSSKYAAMIAVAVLIVTILAAWIVTTPATNAPELNVDKVIATHLAAAERAFELGSFVDPPGLSAAHFYTLVLDLDPKNVRARRGMDEIADRLIADGKQLIDAGDLLRAQSTVDNVRRMQPNHRELADVTAFLLKAREAERLAIQSARSAVKPNVESAMNAISSTTAVNPRIAAAASHVVEKPSVIVETERRSPHRGGSQRQESASGAKPTAIGAVNLPAASKSSGMTLAPNAVDATASVAVSLPSPRITQPNQTQLNQPQTSADSSSAMRTGGAMPVEPAQDEGPLRVASKGAAEAAATEAPAAVMGGPSIAGPISTTATPSAVTSFAAGKVKLLKYVPPAYPYKARAAGIEGWVDVNILVTGDGSVTEPRIENSTLGNNFHRAALAAVSQWKFSPEPNDAVANRPMIVRVQFRLTK